MASLRSRQRQDPAVNHERTSGEDLRVWRTADAVHVDVRGLDPPQPMLTILRLLDQAASDDVIVAHLDREPIFLYPELDARGWRHELTFASDEEAGPGGDDVRLRLFR